MVIKTSDIAMTFLVFAMVTLGFVTFATSFTNEYGEQLPEEFTSLGNNITAALNQTTALGTDMQNRLTKSSGFTVIDGAAILAGSVIQIIKLPFLLVSLASTLLVNIFIPIGILPIWFINTLVTILMFLLIFAIIKLLMKTET